MLLALSVSVAAPNWLIMLPFGILLLAIAFGPLVAQHHWERHYHKLCVALAGIVCLYHLFVVQETARVARAGIDYVTFISVVGSFFVVSGGIHLRAKGPSGPTRNMLFLFALLGVLAVEPACWREPLMVLIALGSYFGTPERIRAAHNFTLAPLKEVAWLFLGIFGTMIPVLEYMERSADKLGLNSDASFYWASGLLSGLLDNAPTYLAFFAAALGLHGLDINDSSHITRF